MKSRPGIASWGTALVLLGAAMSSQASSVATPVPQEPNSSRISEIMQRLRDVQRFDDASVAPNGKSVAVLLSGTAPAAQSDDARFPTDLPL